MSAIALLLAACGGGNNPRPDAGMMGTDSGMMMGTDSGMMTGDPCASTVRGMPDRVGCNGFASGDPMPNGPLGTCTPAADPMMNPAGSCTTPNAVCAAEMGAMTGTCFVTCPPASTYISTGGCPTGFRCFTLRSDLGVCFRDCDATHACPAMFTCDAEGSCVGMM